MKIRNWFAEVHVHKWIAKVNIKEYWENILMSLKIMCNMPFSLYQLKTRIVCENGKPLFSIWLLKRKYFQWVFKRILKVLRSQYFPILLQYRPDLLYNRKQTPTKPWVCFLCPLLVYYGGPRSDAEQTQKADLIKSLIKNDQMSLHIQGVGLQVVRKKMCLLHSSLHKADPK